MHNFWTSPIVLGVLYFHALAGVVIQNQISRSLPGRSARIDFDGRAWRDAADRVGASIEGIGSGVVEIRRGIKRVRIREHASPIDDSLSLSLRWDKLLTFQLLRGAGLPVPAHVGFSLRTARIAADFLDESETDCVVKPALGNGAGHGVTTGLRERPQLARAIASAALHSENLLIESQLKGHDYRLLYLDGELIDGCCRKPPTILADGRSSIARLIERSNRARVRYGASLSQTIVTIDLELHWTLARQGWSLVSIPPEGTEVRLKSVVNENSAADNTAAAHWLCPAVVNAGALAARVAGLRFAAIDLVTQDPSLSLETAGGAILGVDGPPDLYYHYNRRDGAFPVAIQLLERLLGPCPEEVYSGEPLGALSTGI